MVKVSLALLGTLTGPAKHPAIADGVLDPWPRPPVAGRPGLGPMT
jgi:hypothetical protein